MYKKYIILLLVFTIFLIFSACDNDEQCREDNYVMLRIGFYKSVIDSLGRQTNSNNTLIVTAKGAGSDSLLYDSVPTQNINLPLNKFDNYSTFNIFLNDTLETFTVFYTTKDEYLSFECGYLTIFSIDSFQISGSYVDSISFINNSVDTQNAENFSFHHHYDYRQ
ncbi:MAG: DUF6452 family protein [Paludibacter sp.]|nr:DUF6452 family protein [Paludibacter sp.]